MKRIVRAGICALAVLTFCATASASTDEEFLLAAIQANLDDISMGELAREVAATEAVRAYGRELIRDHTANNKEAIALALRLGIKAPRGVGQEAMQDWEQLSRLGGNAFDGAFASSLVIGQARTIALFEDKAAEGSSEVSAYAASSLPALRNSLEVAQGINQRLAARGTPAESSPVTMVAPGPADAGPQGFAQGLRDEAARSDALNDDISELSAVVTSDGPETIGAESMIGSTVHGPNGDVLGTVADVITREDGGARSIEAVIVDVGESLAVDSKLVVLSPTSLKFRRIGGGIRVDTGVAREQLAAAPVYKPETYTRESAVTSFEHAE